jgi:branched-chain amino acid transport system permease protein
VRTDEHRRPPGFAPSRRDGIIWSTAREESEGKMSLTDIATDVERQDKITEDALRYIWHRTIQPLVTPDLIEEHRSNPFGQHSPTLDMVLTFLRSDPVRTIPRLVVVTITPEREWAIGEHSRRRGVPVRVRPGIYESVDEIEHAIFLERLKATGDAYGTPTPQDN